jgi:hypothetical protein
MGLSRPSTGNDSGALTLSEGVSAGHSCCFCGGNVAAPT